MSANGRLTDGELTAVGGIVLSKKTASAWNAMVAAAQEEAGIDLTIARPAGGYRSYFVQGDMKVHPGAYGLNPASSVSLASAGNSTHGFGTRVDIANFSGARATWVLANSKRFGFTREFGAADPNHFAHDGVTAVGTITTSSTNKTPLEDTLSAAEVKSINDNTNLRAAEVKATLANIEKLLAIGDDGKGGIRGDLSGLKATGANIENILAKENSGGIRSMVSTAIGLLQRLVAKTGA